MARTPRGVTPDRGAGGRSRRPGVPATPVLPIRRHPCPLPRPPRWRRRSTGPLILHAAKNIVRAERLVPFPRVGIMYTLPAGCQNRETPWNRSGHGDAVLRSLLISPVKIKAEIVSRGDRKDRKDRKEGKEGKIGIFLACLAILAREKSGFSDFTRRRGDAEKTRFL